MGGKPKDPAYWVKYRAAHPDYRKRETARSKRNKAANRTLTNQRENERRKRRRAEQEKPAEIEPFAGHEIFQEVQSLAPPKPSSGRIYQFNKELDWEDALMEGVVAKLEGKDPLGAIKGYFSMARRTAKMVFRFLDDENFGYNPGDWNDE